MTNETIVYNQILGKNHVIGRGPSQRQKPESAKRNNRIKVGPFIRLNLCESLLFL